MATKNYLASREPSQKALNITGERDSAQKLCDNTNHYTVYALGKEIVVLSLEL